MIPDVLKSLSWPILGIIVGVIVLVIAGVYLYTRKDASATVEIPPTSTEPQTEKEFDAALQGVSHEEDTTDTMTTDQPPI